MFLHYIYTLVWPHIVLVSLVANLDPIVSDGCIRDLRFNPCLHQNLIGILVW